MPRILHICPDFWPGIGGIEQFVFELARSSREIGFEPSILCFNRIASNPRRLPAVDCIADIPIRRIPFVHLLFYKPTLLPISALQAADILHVHGIGAMLDFTVATRALHRRPIVVSTHGGIFHTPRLAKLKRFYFGRIQPTVMALVDRLVACSAGDYEMFRPIKPDVLLIENGVDVERFTCATQKVPRRFLTVSRLSRNKRLDQLIAAFAEAHRLGLDFELRIVGPDWERQRSALENLARSEGIADRIQFTGEINRQQLVEEYAAASFFVSASEHEGFGITAVEAMAAGCVPVLNNIDAYRRLIDSGNNGWLTDFSHAPAAGAAFVAAASADIAAMRSAAIHSAQRFSWKTVIQQWRRLYLELLPEGAERVS